jgi:hypothetical protein
MICYTAAVLIKTMQGAGGPSFFRIILIAVLYSLFFWRTIKSNRGNRVIECGCVALTAFMVLMVLININGLPEWLIPSLGALLLFLLPSDDVLLGAANDQVFSPQQIKIEGLNAVSTLHRDVTVAQPRFHSLADFV